MRSIILSSLLLFFIGANAQQNGKINKGETWHRIYPNQSFELQSIDGENYSVLQGDGEDLTFEYYKRADEYVEMSDDEYTEKIVFSVPKNAKSFNYTGATLKAAFLRGCFCPDRGWHAISDGFIKGKKINATTWQVEVDVMTKPNPSRGANAVSRKFKATFKLYNPVVKK
jgi:hypothetical protein